MPYKDQAKKKAHNKKTSTSAEGQHAARHRKDLQRYRESQAEAYWKFQRRGINNPALIARCTHRCIEQARLRVDAEYAQQTEVIVLPAGEYNRLLDERLSVFSE